MKQSNTSLPSADLEGVQGGEPVHTNESCYILGEGAQESYIQAVSGEDFQLNIQSLTSILNNVDTHEGLDNNSSQFYVAAILYAKRI